MPSPITTTLTDIVDRANDLFSDNDDATCIATPCNRNIRPVYPVRYAYMNYFTMDLVEPQSPPPIQTLLTATSQEEAKGYAARVLREGWVYVKEEEPLKTRGSQPSKGILIFKHILNEMEGQDIAGVQEIFCEYEWDNHAREYREKKQDCPPQGFLPIKKDVKKISLLFSDIPLSQTVLTKLNKNIEFRQKVMQSIDLDSEDTYTLELTEENLSALVEDYKPKEQQFARYHNGVDFDDGYSYQLSYATTQQSYFIDPIKKNNTFKACYGKGEKGTLVILHDPVGRQKDILDIYSFLVTYLKSFFESYEYPITIGNYIEALLKNDSDDIRKTVSESINKAEWESDWADIKYTIAAVNARKAQILSLYNAFAFNKTLANVPYDGLKSHLINLFGFFTDSQGDWEVSLREVSTFIDLFYDITNTLQFTELGVSILERFFNQELTALATVKQLQDKHQLADYVLKYSMLDKYDLLPAVATVMLDTEIGRKAFKTYSETLPTEEGSLTEDWKDILEPLKDFLDNKILERPDVKGSLIKTLDKLFVVFGKGFAMALTYMGYLAKGSHVLKGRELMAEFAQKCAKFAGIEIKVNQTQTVSGQTLDETLKTMGVGKNDKSRPEKLKMGKKLFDWEALTAHLKLEKWITLPSVTKIQESASRFGTSDSSVNGKNVVHYIDGALPGLSLCVNTLIIFSLGNQSVYKRNNPLQSRSLTYYGLKMTEGFIAAMEGSKSTVDISKQLRKLKLFSNSKILKAITRLPRSPALHHMGVMKSFRYLGLAGAATSVGISAYEAYNSYRIGNYLNMSFKITTGVGYALMAVGIAGAFVAKRVVWPYFLFIGTATMLLGTAGDLATDWGDLETIIKNCFWGNSKQYAFWNDAKGDYSSRMDKIQKNLPKTISGSLIENQEFINLFYMPNLEWVYSSKTLTFKMELSNFLPYDSQVFYQFCSTVKTKNSQAIARYKEMGIDFIYDNTFYIKKEYAALNLDLADQIKNHYIYNSNTQTTTLEMVIETPKDFYFGDEIFLYYRPFDDNIAPLRYNWEGDNLAELEVIHYGKMVRRSGGQSWS
ncbi:toxin VasX [Providencia stuartii]|uniref:toxin VasX n=1 Tax=Providencia stuartii TaxID=588 RepID=UPI0024B1C91D